MDHASEVREGIRFEFGKNWRRFLSALTDERIAIAEQSLVEYLQQPRLDGLRFLDIGSGSGLFSLASFVISEPET
jgi:2-polyprenyl-6-hydroxyphenyl methylase/3-demethylubiquinone-9 3-methyltransferase